MKGECYKEGVNLNFLMGVCLMTSVAEHCVIYTREGSTGSSGCGKEESDGKPVELAQQKEAGCTQLSLVFYRTLEKARFI